MHGFRALITVSDAALMVALIGILEPFSVPLHFYWYRRVLRVPDHGAEQVLPAREAGVARRGTRAPRLASLRRPGLLPQHAISGDQPGSGMTVSRCSFARYRHASAAARSRVIVHPC